MGRIWNFVLGTFRVIQLILSLGTVGIGAYITYKFYSMAESAKILQTALDKINGDASIFDTVVTDANEDTLKAFTTVVQPILNILEGTPIRAIIVTATSFISIMVTIYMFFARRSKHHQGANRRRWRVPLELITLLLWCAALVCSIFLLLEFGVMLFGGAEAKVAYHLLKDVIEEAIKMYVSSKSDEIGAVLNIVDTITTLGLLALIAVIACAICLKISFISLIVACCTKADANVEYDPLYIDGHDKSTSVGFSQVSTPSQWISPQMSQYPPRTRLPLRDPSDS